MSSPTFPQPGTLARLRARAVITALVLAWLGDDPAQAQTSPAFGLPVSASQSSAPDQMPLADYLGLLQKISPAAETGARTYLAAVQLRCGRVLGTPDLRRALSDGEGDPLLLGLIRAAHLQDGAARQRLIAEMRCPQGAPR